MLDAVAVSAVDWLTVTAIAGSTVFIRASIDEGHSAEYLTGD